MERLLQTFELPFVDTDGETYDIHLYGRSRLGDTWQGWLGFQRRRDAHTFATDVETTQPSAEAVIYWATGLGATYFEGAFARARRPNQRASRTAAAPTPAPLRDGSASHTTYLHRLRVLEQDILRVFTRHDTPQLTTENVLAALPHAHADVIRALEDLEKEKHLLVRRTEWGNDWLLLTTEGLRATGLTRRPHTIELVSAEAPKNWNDR